MLEVNIKDELLSEPSILSCFLLNNLVVAALRFLSSQVVIFLSFLVLSTTLDSYRRFLIFTGSVLTISISLRVIFSSFSLKALIFSLK